MKLKSILFVFLSVLLWTGCNEDEVSNISQENDITYFKVQMDIDYLTETYGPALTRGITKNDPSALTRSSDPGHLQMTYAYPVGISSITILPDKDVVVPEGEERDVIVIGSFSALSIRAYDAINQQVLSQNVVVENTGYGIGKLSIPRYTTTSAGAVRMIFFEYFNSQTYAWELFSYAVQQAEPVDEFRTWSDIIDDLPAEGAYPVIHISGNFPTQAHESVFFRAVDDLGEAISNTVAIIGTSAKSTILTISENTSERARTIYLQYAFSTAIEEWITFETHKQLGVEVNYEFYLLIPTLPAMEVIPSAGGIYDVFCVGNFPLDRVQIKISNNRTQGYEYLSFGDAYKVTWICPENTSKRTKQWTLEYSINEGDTWVTWQENTQDRRPNNSN